MPSFVPIIFMADGISVLAGRSICRSHAVADGYIARVVITPADMARW